MDLRQIRYVLAVVDEGGFTAAARSVPVAQPSLSQAVQSLEQELGVRLFDRAGRRVVLTSAGEAFVAGARRVERDVATLRAAVDAVRGLEGGRLDIVSLPTLAVSPLAGILGRFRVAHPAVHVRVAESEEVDEAADAVAQGDSELALTELPGPRGALDAIPLEHQELLAVLPPGTHLGGTTYVSIEMLAAHPLVATPPATSTRRLIEEAMASAGLSPDIAVEITHREALVQLVLAGAGACVLPASLAEQAAARGAVVRRVRPAIRRQIGLLHRPGPLSPAAAAFVSLAVGAPPRAARHEP